MTEITKQTHLGRSTVYCKMKEAGYRKTENRQDSRSYARKRSSSKPAGFYLFYIDFIELFKTAEAGQKGTVNRSLSAFYRLKVPFKGSISDRVVFYDFTASSTAPRLPLVTIAAYLAK